MGSYNFNGPVGSKPTSKIPDREERLLRIECEIQKTVLRAQWWTAYASSGGGAGQRTISRLRKPTTEEQHLGVMGSQLDPFTPEELVEDAFNTAKGHIQRLEGLYECKIAIMLDDPVKLDEALKNC